MMSRVWHGWTTPENADAYERLLRDEIFPEIAAKRVAGYRRIELFRRTTDSGEIEFVTIMWFDSLDAVKEFAGENYERAYVPKKARDVLLRFTESSLHFDVREQRKY